MQDTGAMRRLPPKSGVPPEAEDFVAFLGRTRVEPALPLTAQVYDILRSAIVTMKLLPGATLNERQICEHLGISRTPVREAVLQLAGQNLIRVRPNAGTFVSHIRVREVLEGHLAREAIEMRLVRLAARQAGPDAVERLDLSLFRQAQVAQRRDVDRFFALDEAFHRALAGIAGFPNIWRLLDGPKGQLDRVRRLAFPVEDNFDQVLAEHTYIAAAVKAHDEEAAAAAMHRHLVSITDTIVMVCRGFPEHFAEDGEPIPPVY
jgi:DNA-binding GntR family transcriptional regulator